MLLFKDFTVVVHYLQLLATRCLCYFVIGLKVREDVNDLLRSEGFEIHHDDDRLRHLLSLYQSTKVY